MLEILVLLFPLLALIAASALNAIIEQVTGWGQGRHGGPPMNTPWREIMEELRGMRLRVYDSILDGEAVDEASAPVQNALGWLAYHHFVWRSGVRLMARRAHDAKYLWQTQGAAPDADRIFHLPERGGASEPPASFEGLARTPSVGDNAPAHPDGVRVHAHQQDLIPDERL